MWYASQILQLGAPLAPNQFASDHGKKNDFMPEVVYASGSHARCAREDVSRPSCRPQPLRTFCWQDEKAAYSGSFLILSACPSKSCHEATPSAAETFVTQFGTIICRGMTVVSRDMEMCSAADNISKDQVATGLAGPSVQGARMAHIGLHHKAVQRSQATAL